MYNNVEGREIDIRSYPELTMKLLARNKTSYGLGGMGSRRGDRDIDMLHSRYYRDRFDRDRFGRDPFDSDSDDEMSDLLMRAGYGRRALRGMAAEGDMDQRLLDMIFKEERRKRRDEDYHRRQTAVRKEKKQEPTIKVEPKPEEKPANKIEPKPSEEKPANKIEPKPSEEKPTIKVEPKPSEEKPANKIEPKPSEEKPANKIEPKTLEVGGKDKGSLGPDVIIKVSASAKLDQKPASIPKTAENDKDCPDPGPVSKDSVLSEEKNHPVTMNSGIKDSKPDGVEKPKKPVPFPLSGEASMDEMSIEDTADGVILYSEADRTTVDDKMGVTEAITVLKTETQTRVPNLQLRLLDELPIGGKTEFNYIEYILSHFNYIFIYLTPNFTPDTLKRFQSQMCLMDTIQNKSWRVIPIVREKDIANMPLEMQVLRPLQLWNLKNPDKRVQNMAVESFAKTILAGRENGYATKYPSLGASRNIVQQPDAAAKVPLNKQVPAKPPNISSEAPSDRQQGNAGSQVPNPSENNTTEEDAELGSDEESLTGEEKPGLKKATPGLHTLLHKHSGGGVTKISFTSRGKIPNLQVGNKNVMIIGASGDVEKKKSKSKKSKENVKLTDSEEPLSKDNIDAVCSEIGQEWRRLCRKMGFSDGECDQFRQDFYVSGTYEIMYQAFRKWIQKSPGEAIQKNLAEMLHELDRDDLATKL